MTILSPVQLHKRATQMEIRDVARELVSALGPTMVASAVGAKDTKLPAKWAKDSGPHPSDRFQARLISLHRFWNSLAQVEGPNTARQWFLGGNPLLRERTPLTAVREGEDELVARAIEAFLRGEQDV